MYFHKFFPRRSCFKVTVTELASSVSKTFEIILWQSEHCVCKFTQFVFTSLFFSSKRFFPVGFQVEHQQVDNFAGQSGRLCGSCCPLLVKICHVLVKFFPTGCLSCQAFSLGQYFGTTVKSSQFYFWALFGRVNHFNVFKASIFGDWNVKKGKTTFTARAGHLSRCSRSPSTTSVLRPSREPFFSWSTCPGPQWAPVLLGVLPGTGSCPLTKSRCAPPQQGMCNMTEICSSSEPQTPVHIQHTGNY